jgi:hypothetical protein
MVATERRGRLSEWTVALGLGLKLTKDYFGARDGRQRTEPAPPAAPVETVDAAAPLTAGAIAAAAAAATAAPPSSAAAVARREGAVSHA